LVPPEQAKSLPNATDPNIASCAGRMMSSEVNPQLIQGHAYLREALSKMQLGTKLGANIQEKVVPTKDCSMEMCSAHSLGQSKEKFWLSLNIMS